MGKKQKPKLSVLVSSSVYGKEALITLICTTLQTFGYDAWNSNFGTLPVHLNTGTYETCIKAVEDCDIFFGLITPQYGTGTDGAGGPAITHREFARAIELNKPRLVLAHNNVILARRLLMDLGIDAAARAKFTLKKGSPVIDDLRIIDMYDAAIQDDREIPDRDNNWVQRYHNDEDVKRYLVAQFSRYEAMERFVEEWQNSQKDAQA